MRYSAVAIARALDADRNASGGGRHVVGGATLLAPTHCRATAAGPDVAVQRRRFPTQRAPPPVIAAAVLASNMG